MNMEFVTYILSDFWHFIGFCIILILTFDGINDIIQSIKK